jgi:phosphoserine phosphatase RsbU/P
MIRALLVDDERPARDRLRQLLRSFSDVEVVGEAEDGEQALERIAETRPDLLFLDIQMPGRSGLEVAMSLTPPRPKVIFCTAFDQYAIEAFEQNAVDYLLKPVNRTRLGKAIDHLRHSAGELSRLQGELAAAEKVQSQLFPKALPLIEGLDYSGSSRPARGIGGDYYDFLSLGSGKLGIALGDVSGKGIYAGLLMASLQGRLQARAPQHHQDVASLMSELNRMMCSVTDSSQFATLFYCVYDSSTRSLIYVNAGHNAPMLFQSPDSNDNSIPYRNGPAQRTPGEPHKLGRQRLRLEAGGTIIGKFPETTFQQQTVHLKSGDILVIFSDGITEARNSVEEEFGEERLVTATIAHRHLAATELRDHLLEEVAQFTGRAAQQDDLTLVVVKVA